LHELIRVHCYFLDVLNVDLHEIINKIYYDTFPRVFLKKFQNMKLTNLKFKIFKAVTEIIVKFAAFKIYREKNALRLML
jgi:hypothetical protein